MPSSSATPARSRLALRAGDRAPRWGRFGAWAGLLPAAALLSWLAFRAPDTTDRLYSRGAFDLIAVVLRFVAGLFPFSLGEATLVLLLAWGLARGLRGALAYRRGQRSARNLLVHAALQLTAAACVVYALFVALWGLNYARLPFAAHAGLDVRPATVAELRATAEWLVGRANDARATLPEDEAGVLAFRADRADVLARLGRVYARASDELPVLVGLAPVARRPLLSPLMTAGGIAGIYWPFTGEPHVNGQLLAFELPFAACHEVAHARGFAREDEANYIAYRVCELSGEADFRYSGLLIASIHALRALQRADAGAAKDVAGQRTPAVERDLAALRDFWNPTTRVVRFVRTGAQEVNDTFLKANRQADGVASYGRMVDLLVAQQRARR